MTHTVFHQIAWPLPGVAAVEPPGAALGRPVRMLGPAALATGPGQVAFTGGGGPMMAFDFPRQA